MTDQRGPVQKTLLTVTVLHRPDETPDFTDLASIQYAINEGPCIGSTDHDTTTTLAEDEIVSELRAIGNDGTFFDPID